jgi:hypothetical protein
MYKNLREQERHLQHLSAPIKDAISWYTGGNFDTFNQYLRSNRALPQNFRTKLELIDDAFAAAPPIITPVVVYKGKGSDRIYSDKAFMSTTLDYTKTKRFSGKNCCVVQITISPGSKVLPLRDISREPDEEEVLLDRNGFLLVTGSYINDKDRMKIIFTTYSSDESKLVKNDSQISKAEKQFDNSLMIQRIIQFFSDDDPDFLDEDEIKIMYKKIAKRDLSVKDLAIIKTGLHMQ